MSAIFIAINSAPAKSNKLETKVRIKLNKKTVTLAKKIISVTKIDSKIHKSFIYKKRISDFIHFRQQKIAINKRI